MSGAGGLGDASGAGVLGDASSLGVLGDAGMSAATDAGVAFMGLRSVADIAGDIASRLPEGWAWDLAPTSNTRRSFRPLERYVADFETAAVAQLDEAEPDTAELLLDGYERVLGPDTCMGDPQTLTLAQRRMSATARWIASRGASKAELIALAAGYGAVITITEFRRTPAGVLRAGTPRVCHPQELTVVVGLPSTQVIPFTAGLFRSGNSIGKIQRATVIECVVRRAAPARVTLVFSYASPPQFATGAVAGGYGGLGDVGVGDIAIGDEGSIGRGN